MKAEHRKELETNTLADKMGQAVQRVKSGRRSTFILTLIVAALVAVALWIVYANVTEGKKSDSDRWIKFDDGGQKQLLDLMKDGTTPAGKGARLQYAWMAYWEVGVKKMGTDARGAMIALEEAGQVYREVAKDCADEDPPLFLPQAMLGIAVVDECRAIQDRAFLEKAKQAYQALFDKYKKEIDGKFQPTTAESKFAKDRLEQLNDAKKLAEITAIYDELQKVLGVRALQQIPDGMPPLLKGLDPKDLPPLPPPDKK